MNIDNTSRIIIGTLLFVLGMAVVAANCIFKKKANPYEVILGTGLIVSGAALMGIPLPYLKA